MTALSHAIHRRRMQSITRAVIRVVIATVLSLAILFLVALGPIFWMSSMPGDANPQRVAGQHPTLSQGLEAHVRELAGERNTIHAGRLDRAAMYIDSQLQAMGYEVQSQWYETAGTRVRNIFVVIPAADATSGIIVAGAHYDSSHHTIGADDNASGVAALLEIARAMKGPKSVPPRKSLHLVFFTNEEPPYFRTKEMGSYRYAESLARRAVMVEAMLSLEMLGFYCDTPGCQHYPFPLSIAFPNRGNFVGFVGNLDSRDLTRRVVGRFRSHATIPSEGVTAPAFIQGVDYSDQLWFWALGYPAVMVTDTSFMRNPHYHKPTDTPNTLDYVRMAAVVSGLSSTIADLIRAP